VQPEVAARIRGFVERQRARLLVLAALAAYFLALAAVGGHSRWGRLGVPPGQPAFEDMRNVTGALECTRRGLAVLPVNPCDPHRRPADFPRIWLALSHLALGPGDTVALGVGLAVVFLAAALVVVPAGASLWTGALYALVLCSPAVMLGVERGNPDLAVFPFVLAAVLVSPRTRLGQVASGALLLFVSILKLYPVFAVGAFVRRATRTSLVTAAGVAVCFLVYLAATEHYVREILSSIQAPSTLAYGVRRLTMWFSALAVRLFGGFGSFRAWDLVLVVVALGLGWLCARRLAGSAPSPDEAEATRDLDLFWAGACIYCGSYMIFVSQDYRLVFLLLTVPQTARWVRERRSLAFVLLPALLVTLWLDVWTGMPGLKPALDWWQRVTAVGSASLPAAVVAQYVLFASLIGWLIATAPPVSVPKRRAA
jgi:Glycosyltransferase family 87